MDRESLITLHPQAYNFLFKHYQTLMRIFRDVLGLFEVEYLAIAFIDSNNELLFCSSMPSIEANLIEHNLWNLDPCYKDDFFQKKTMQLWENIYSETEFVRLRYYKQEVHKYTLGLALPDQIQDYRVVYSFAVKTNNALLQYKLKNKPEWLLKIGQYCLKNILESIALPNALLSPKPILKLISNNKVIYETSRTR